MGQFEIGIKRSQQTFQEHELIKRGTQEKEQELTLQSYITPQRNGEHKNSKQSQSQTANNSKPQGQELDDWELSQGQELDDWELEMVVGGIDPRATTKATPTKATPTKATPTKATPTLPTPWP